MTSDHAYAYRIRLLHMYYVLILNACLRSLQLGSPGDHSPQTSLFRRHASSRGSMRKMLPPTPDMDTQMSLSAKMIDRRTSTPKGNHSYGPFFLEYSLLAEFNLLQKQKMPGVYVIPSSTSPLCKYCLQPNPIFQTEGRSSSVRLFASIPKETEINGNEISGCNNCFHRD